MNRRAHCLPPGASPTSPSSVTEIRCTYHREARPSTENLNDYYLRAAQNYSERAPVEVARRPLHDGGRRLHGLLRGVELFPEFGQVRAALEVGH